MSIFIFRHYDFMFCLFGHKIIVFGTMFLFGKKILLVALLSISLEFSSLSPLYGWCRSLQNLHFFCKTSFSPNKILLLSLATLKENRLVAILTALEDSPILYLISFMYLYLLVIYIINLLFIVTWIIIYYVSDKSCISQQISLRHIKNFIFSIHS